MPIYEYQCESCAEIIEAWQNLSEAPLTTCPSCAGPLKKLISMSSFQLKGGGWYADGYSSGKSTAKSSPSTTSTAKSPAAAPATCPKKDGATCSCS